MTGVAGLTFTVTRGVEGSTAATHANAATVTHVLTAGALGAISTDHTALTDPHAGKYPALSLVTAKGDLMVGTGAGAMIGLPAGANDTVLVADSAQVAGVRWGSGVVGPTGATGATGSTGATGAQGSSGPPGAMVVSGAAPYILMQEQQNSGTASQGTFTAGAFRTRTLNTVLVDTAGLVSLASNQFTLPAGTYRISASGPAQNANATQTRLQNVTDAGTVLLGTTEFTAAGSVVTRSFLVGRFGIASTKTFEFQQRFAAGGGGPAASFGTEVYTVVELWLEGGPPPFFGRTITTEVPPRLHSGRIARQSYAAMTAVVQHSLDTPPQ